MKFKFSLSKEVVFYIGIALGMIILTIVNYYIQYPYFYNEGFKECFYNLTGLNLTNLNYEIYVLNNNLTINEEFNFLNNSG